MLFVVVGGGGGRGIVQCYKGGHARTQEEQRRDGECGIMVDISIQPCINVQNSQFT